MKKYKNANEAFINLYNNINNDGIIYKNTKSLFNIGFYIENPIDNEITEPIRKWKKSYAEYEWKWYLSKNRSIKKIKKIAKIWDTMHNGNNKVMSNYGWQWNRKNQIDYIINELKRDRFSRRACITIYDGKEHLKYKYDTPCTLNINFYILNDKLNMNILMRSNDIHFTDFVMINIVLVNFLK